MARKKLRPRLPWAAFARLLRLRIAAGPLVYCTVSGYEADVLVLLSGLPSYVAVRVFDPVAANVSRHLLAPTVAVQVSPLLAVTFTLPATTFRPLLTAKNTVTLLSLLGVRVAVPVIVVFVFSGVAVMDCVRLAAK